MIMFVNEVKFREMHLVLTPLKDYTGRVLPQKKDKYVLIMGYIDISIKFS